MLEMFPTNSEYSFLYALALFCNSKNFFNGDSFVSDDRHVFRDKGSTTLPILYCCLYSTCQCKRSKQYHLF